LDVISHSPQQTRRLAARLAELLRGGETICLSGELGVGKTTFVQGLGEGLGITEPIISPTFTLIREYEPVGDRPTLFHIDFYRLEKPQDYQSLGLDDYFYSDGVCAVEWPERAPDLLPEERLWIDMRFLNDMKRGLLMRADGQRYQELLEAFRKRAFGV
jgi:tRNA threonylcarbamoyladenosine biosynthesis protein TsaE